MVLRKLAVALLGVGVLLPGLAHALAIGDIKTRSALNEPYLGEVLLADVGDLTADEIRVDMATPEEFHQMGVDWSSQLTDLSFQVLKRSDGRTVIRVTSHHPVTEPDLDFVLRVSWPGNTSMREFVALLDLPSAKMAAAPVAPAAVSAPLSSPMPEASVAAPTPTPMATATATATATSSSAPRTPAVSSIRTHAGENLWSLARHVHVGHGLTAEQVMIALQRRNPAAFPEHNINLLAVGHTLIVPSVDEMRRINARDAANEVARQDQVWRAGGATQGAHRTLEKQQVEAAPTTGMPSATQPSQAEVHLLAPGSKARAQAAAQVGKYTRVTQVEQENSRLRQSLQQDQDKLQAQSAQIKVQDAELAKLEQALHAQAPKSAAKATLAQPAVTPPPVTVRKPPVALAQAAPAQTAVIKPQAPKPQAPKPQPAVKVMAPVTPAPVASSTETSSTSMVLWGAAALAALAGLVGGLIALRRRRDEHRQIGELTRRDQSLAADVGEDPVHLDLENADFDHHLDDLHDYHDAGAAGAEVSAQDVLVEANELMQRRLYPQAIGVLSKALRTHPERDDLRIMLMEAMAEIGDHDGFSEQEQQLTAGDLDMLEIVEELRSRLPAAAPASATDAGYEHEHKHAAGALDFSAPEPMQSALVTASAGDADLAHDQLGHDELAHDELADLDFSLSDLDLPNAAAAQPHDTLPVREEADLAMALDDPLGEPASLDFAPSAPVMAEDEGIAWHAEEALPAGVEDLAVTTPVSDAPASPEVAKTLDFGDVILDEEALPAPEDLSLQTASAEAVDDEALDLDLSALDEPMASAPLAEEALSFDELPSADELESFALTDDFDLEHESGSADLDLASQREEREAQEEELAWESSAVTAEAPTAASAAQEFDLALPDVEASLPSAEATALSVTEPEEVAVEAADGDFDLGSEFDFLADADENATKIDLAKAYIDMGDAEGARDILQEVIHDGSPEQQEEARTLLTQAG